jgi:hypothetical protein
MSLEMGHKAIVPQKKIMSRSFLNSGTLIVNMESCTYLTCADTPTEWSLCGTDPQSFYWVRILKDLHDSNQCSGNSP